MSMFTSALSAHIANELNVNVEDVTKAMNTFIINSGQNTGVMSKETLLETTHVSVNTASSSKNSEKYPCCRIKRSKTEPCGKPSTKNIDDKWYCGSMKSGCYSIMIKNSAKKSIDNERVSTISKTREVTAKPTTNIERSKISEKISNNLINKVIKKDTIITSSITNDDGELLHYELEYRILFDKNTCEAYGVLDEDNNTVNELTDHNKRWLEAHNCKIRETKQDKVESDDELDDLSDDLNDDDLDDDEGELSDDDI